MECCTHQRSYRLASTLVERGVEHLIEEELEAMDPAARAAMDPAARTALKDKLGKTYNINCFRNLVNTWVAGGAKSETV